MGRYERFYKIGQERDYVSVVVTAYSLKNAEELFAEEWRKLIKEYGPDIKQSEIMDITQDEPKFVQGGFEL